MEEIKLIDYKGKHYVLYDNDVELNSMDYKMDRISKQRALEPNFVKRHKELCDYYGVPPYVGRDKDLLNVYK